MSRPGIGSPPVSSGEEPDHQIGQRIDKWLWHARVVKTRTLAQQLLRRGKVRVNRTKVTTVSRAVRQDDVLTIALGQRVRVLRVTAFAERRGSATEAARLFEEIEPQPPR